jgi:GAF domain-containing protein/HAMP domain-containing protein
MTPDEKVTRQPRRSQHDTVKRNALFATLMAFVIVSVTSAVSFYEAIQQNQWQTYADGGVLAVLAIICIVALIMSTKRKIRQATLMMIYSIMIILTLRTAFVSGLGIQFGVIAASGTAVIALLALPPQSASRINLIGLGFGSIMVMLDLLWRFSRPEPSRISAETALVTAILFGTGYLVFIIVQFQRFSFYSKLLLGFTLAALLPTIAIGALSNRITTNALSTKANQILLNSANQTALTLDTFIASNLDAVRSESQLSPLQDYLLALQTGQAYDPAYLDKASSVLRTLSKKDLLFIESYALLSRRGSVMLDTDNQGINENESRYEYFTKPMNTGVPYVSPVLTSPEGKAYLIFSSPVLDTAGEVIGVLRVRYKGAILQQIVSQQNGLAGETSFGILLDENNIILANGNSPYETIKTLFLITRENLAILQSKQLLPSGSPEELSANMPDLEQKLAAGNSNFIFKLSGKTNVQEAGALGTMTQRPWKVVFVQNADVFLGPAQNQTKTNTLMAAIVVFIAAFAAAGIARLLTAPIIRLTSTSEQVAQGNLNLKARVETEDEIGTLASAFNSMTSKLSETIENLESRVLERTKAIERRTLLMQAATEVGRNAASLRDRDALLNQTTRLISQRFGFYHAGIFLIDERGEYAVLQAANSEGGQRMLKRGHKLKVGQTGIVGFVTARGQARIALDVGSDAVYFDNPDMPKTRSEMALPLIASGHILGALDVQSELPNAFADEDIATLQVMADQIAIAIENSRLFEQSQAALESARRAYGETSRTGWQRLLQTKKTEMGYISLPENRIAQVVGTIAPEFLQAMKAGKPTLANNNMTLYMPVIARGETIGAIRLDKPEVGIPWTNEDIQTARELSEQLGTALESARLYNEISERAERESAISEISARIGASVQIDTILRTTVQELGQALSETEVILQLGNQSVKGKRRE